MEGQASVQYVVLFCIGQDIAHTLGKRLSRLTRFMKPVTASSQELFTCIKELTRLLKYEEKNFISHTCAAVKTSIKNKKKPDIITLENVHQIQTNYLLKKKHIPYI